MAACEGHHLPGVSLHLAWCPRLAQSKFNRPGPSRGSAASASLWGRVVELGGKGRPGRRWRQVGPGHQEASLGLESRPGRPPWQPTLHARHVHAARVLLCQTPGRAHPCPEGEKARKEVQGHPAWDYRGKSAARFRFPLPQGTRLLEDCFGIQMAASQETSCTSAANSPWEGGGEGRGAGGGGPALGTEEEREGGRPLPAATCLSPGLLATCPPRSRACPPPSGRPGTASGLPGCS